MTVKSFKKDIISYLFNGRCDNKSFGEDSGKKWSIEKSSEDGLLFKYILNGVKFGSVNALREYIEDSIEYRLGQYNIEKLDKMLVKINNMLEDGGDGLLRSAI